jgi:acyl carrier protein
VDAVETELAQFLVETLQLEDVEAATVDPLAPLFGEGLGLDSVDALELSTALTLRYGLTLPADAVERKAVLASLRALAAWVRAAR